MRFLCALLVFSIFGAQVNALSCRRPNVAQTFNNFQNAEDSYRLMTGQIKMTGRIPNYVDGKPRSAKAQITGKFIGRNGLSDLQSLSITVQTHCVSVWCGGFPQAMDRDFLIYVKQTPQGNVIDIDACPGGIAMQATEGRIKLLQKCLRNGKCSDRDVKTFEFE